MIASELVPADGAAAASMLSNRSSTSAQCRKSSCSSMFRMRLKQGKHMRALAFIFGRSFTPRKNVSRSASSAQASSCVMNTRVDSFFCDNVPINGKRTSTSALTSSGRRLGGVGLSIFIAPPAPEGELDTNTHATSNEREKRGAKRGKEGNHRRI